MLATACSNDEVVSVAPQGGAIGFSSFVDHSTRAEDLTNANLKDLQVWGVTGRGTEVPNSYEFDGTRVYLDGSAWKYDGAKYWIAGNAYSFAAIAPANNSNVTVTKDITKGQQEAGLSIEFNNETAEADVDILYATNLVNTASANQPAVTLNLKHMLSRVQFEFDNEFIAENSYIVIKDVNIIDAVSVATIDKTASAELWTKKGDDTFNIEFQGSENDQQTNPKEKFTTPHKYLIPLTDAVAYNAIFTIELYTQKAPVAEGEEAQYEKNVYKHAVKLPEIAYINNYSYTLKASINAETIDPNNDVTDTKIEFTPVVSDWTPDAANIELPQEAQQ